MENTQEKISPAPWSIYPGDEYQGVSILDADGETVARLYWIRKNAQGIKEIEADPYPEEKARRIVACVNACDGIKDADLAALNGTSILSKANEVSDTITEQRDALLFAIKLALPALNLLREKHPRHPSDDSIDVLEVVKNAIQKAEAGQ
jgi:hypothetical protein